jgi:hypothetical protein
MASGVLFLGSLSAHAQVPLGPGSPGSASISGSGNCTVSATSLSKQGFAVGSMNGGPTAGPISAFEVDPDGSVTWDARSGVPITNHTYNVQIFGVTVMSGGDPNKDKTKKASGTLDLAAVFPFKIVGEIPASGFISGEGGSCSGEAMIFLKGQPAGTIPWDIGAASILVGMLGMGLSSPSARKP